MKGDRLYDIIDYILNEASEQELEVVRSALKRRVEGGGARGAMGVDPGRMARRTAASIRDQLGLSIDQIRSMVADFAAETLKKQAPELTDDQIHELLDAWVPDSELKAAGGKGGGASRTEGAAGGGSGETAAQSPEAGGSRSTQKRSGRGGVRLKPDVILTMVTQFLAYGDESMSVSEQVKLNQEIPDWQRRYWEQFSPRIRELLSLHLRGEIDRATCLERICADLGIDADFSK